MTKEKRLILIVMLCSGYHAHSEKGKPVKEIQMKTITNKDSSSAGSHVTEKVSASQAQTIKTYLDIAEDFYKQGQDALHSVKWKKPKSLDLLNQLSALDAAVFALMNNISVFCAIHNPSSVVDSLQRDITKLLAKIDAFEKECPHVEKVMELKTYLQSLTKKPLTVFDKKEINCYLLIKPLSTFLSENEKILAWIEKNVENVSSAGTLSQRRNRPLATQLSTIGSDVPKTPSEPPRLQGRLLFSDEEPKHATEVQDTQAQLKKKAQERRYHIEYILNAIQWKKPESRELLTSLKELYADGLGLLEKLEIVCANDNQQVGFKDKGIERENIEKFVKKLNMFIKKLTTLTKKYDKADFSDVSTVLSSALRNKSDLQCGQVVFQLNNFLKRCQPTVDIIATQIDNPSWGRKIKNLFSFGK